GAPRPGAGGSRGSEAPQLAAGLERDARRDELRRVVHREGVRRRVLRRGLSPAPRGARTGGLREGRGASRSHARATRAHVPRHPHHDLRRRHQRGAARDHRHGRPRHAAVALGRRGMDFGFSPEQEALRDLARSICQDHATHDRLKVVERDPGGIDRELWTALAKANLLGVALPESAGGSGLGLVELCLLLEQVGAAVAPVPVWASLVLGALPVAEFGSAAQRERWLPGGAAGAAILTAALVELRGEEPAMPATRAVRDGAGWRLDGAKDCVPAAHLASAILVPARTGDGQVGGFLVEPSAPGGVLDAEGV